MCNCKYTEASCTYQTEGAVLGPQQVGQQTWQVGLVPPAPAGSVEVGWDGEVNVRQKTSDETQTQWHKATKRELLFQTHSKDTLGYSALWNRFSTKIQNAKTVDGSSVKFLKLTEA